MGMTNRQKLNKMIICKDKFQMSVQAHEYAHCLPRKDGAESYTHVEVGFPNSAEALLMEYAEEPNDPTGTVYGYVPAALVYTIIVKHGGMISGELPNGIPKCPAELFNEDR